MDFAAKAYRESLSKQREYFGRTASASRRLSDQRGRPLRARPTWLSASLTPIENIRHVPEQL